MLSFHTDVFFLAGNWSGDAKMPLGVRLRLLGRTIRYLLFQGIYTTMWTIDDLFMAGYRAIDIVKPVFIVSHPRCKQHTLSTHFT